MKERSERPVRVRMPDFAGRLLSLPDTPDAWECLSDGSDLLLLGPGPGSPESLPFVRKAAQVYWLESPGGPAFVGGAIPSHWRAITAAEVFFLAERCAVYFYRPGLRLAPDFWGPLLGRLDAAGCGAPLDNAGSVSKMGAPLGRAGRGAVILPGNDRQLLHLEMRDALREAGFGPVVETLPRIAGGCGMADVRQALATGKKPVLVFSINLRGLDGEGRLFHLFRALGIPVAIWFVDNPWHVLSSVRLPWWREAALFVTDASFVPHLGAAGAKRVHHLPLAVPAHMWRPVAGLSESPPLFVGRSAFPDRERFFAAADVPEDLLVRARALLDRADGPALGPHFHWWRRQLDVPPWPGGKIRAAGLGAEICSRMNRARWVGAGLSCGLQVVGDEGWKSLLPDCTVLPPVDYYTELPELYHRSRATLNVTSLLLPHSLNQRHFDVWAAGGYLLTDMTPGLELFPNQLLKPVILRRPEDLPSRLESMAAHPARAHSLRLAWREHLREGHTYAHRVEQIVRALDL